MWMQASDDARGEKTDTKQNELICVQQLSTQPLNHIFRTLNYPKQILKEKTLIFTAKKNFIVSEHEDDHCDVPKTLVVFGKKIDGLRNNKGVISNHGDDAKNKVDGLKIEFIFTYSDLIVNTISKQNIRHSVQFENEILNVDRSCSRSPETTEFGHITFQRPQRNKPCHCTCLLDLLLSDTPVIVIIFVNSFCHPD